MVRVTDTHGCTITASATVSQPTALTATASTGANVSCNGDNNGSVSVTPGGGTSPYSYSWNTTPVQTTATASGLPAGTYMATVTDAHGCTITASTAITQPAALTATASTITHVSCNGGNNGSVSVVPGGGTTPYTYIWNTIPVQTTATATGLVASTYMATVTDAHGCTITASATIAQPVTLTALASTVANVSCKGGNNGSVTVTPGGGVTPYAYSWNTTPVQTTATASGLPAGTYMATVTDANGCVTTASSSVTEPDLLTAASAAGAIKCNGGTTTVTVTAAGGTMPYTGTGEFTVSAGTYNYTATDANGCSAITSITITEPTALSLVTTSKNASCNNGNDGEAIVTVTGGTAPYNYIWDSNTGNQTGSTATGLKIGTYNVTVTDNNGCTQVAQVTVGGEASSIEITSAITAPTCNGASNGSIKVDVSGGTIPYAYNWSNGGSGNAITGLVAGVYIVTVTDAVGCAKSLAITETQPDSIDAVLVSPQYNNGYNVSGNNGTDGRILSTVTGGTQPYIYAWSNGGTTPDLQNLSAGVYYLKITDDNGCLYNGSITLSAPSVLEMPTGFTPNGDGKNDLFVIHGIDAYPDNKLVVFNRWGNEVFSAYRYNNTWNGSSEGNTLPDGTYFVVLTINGGEHGGNMTLKGYVDLRR